MNEKASQMTSKQLRDRGIQDNRVLTVMSRIQRHLYVPPEYESVAYEDRPVSITNKQTISQPYVVALMTELLELKNTDRVLEIGTGSGYQTAVLASITKQVYSVERIAALSEKSQNVLKEQGFNNIEFKIGDGNKGWSEKSLFDKIIVTACPNSIPTVLYEQLNNHGILVAPYGPSENQNLVKCLKKDEEIVQEVVLPVRFVPMLEGVIEGEKF